MYRFHITLTTADQRVQLKLGKSVMRVAHDLNECLFKKLLIYIKQSPRMLKTPLP